MTDRPQVQPYVHPVLANSVLKAGMTHASLTESRDPQKALVALEMLASGATYKEIVAQTGFSMDTIARLRSRHETSVEQRRKELAERSLEIVEGLHLLQKEKIRQLAEDPEELKKTNIRDLTLPFGIAFDKYMMALGENKVTVEHKSAAPSIADALKAIEEAREKNRRSSIEVNVTETKDGGDSSGPVSSPSQP